MTPYVLALALLANPNPGPDPAPEPAPAPAPDPAEDVPSRLVEPNHTHRWELIHDGGKDKTWIDRHWFALFEHRGKTYPTRLVRIRVRRLLEVVKTDLKLAFDCEARQFAITEAWARTTLRPGGAIAQIDWVTFDAVSDPPSPSDTALLEAACAETPAQ